MKNNLRLPAGPHRTKGHLPTFVSRHAWLRPLQWLLTGLLLVGLSTLSWGQQCFNTSTVSLGYTTAPISNSPVSEATGDFNGDGKLDLAFVSISSNNVGILLNAGNGTLGPVTNFAVGSNPRSVAVGDFNGDGKPDLAVGNVGSNTVSILLNTGGGSFGPAANFAVGTYPVSIAVGDFNGDGKPDVATANQATDNVSVLLNAGGGNFGGATNFAVGAGPNSLVAGDFNGDGKADLATTNFNSNNVSVLLGNGSGSFSPAPPVTVSSGPYKITSGDFNGDGRLDLAVLTISAPTIAILLGNGSGGFGAAPTISLGFNSYNIGAGDFNGDGKTDLVAAGYTTSNVVVFLSKGDGSFGPGTTFATGVQPYVVLVGDFNGDGKLDLAASRADDGTTPPYVAIFLGKGDGTFGMAGSVLNPFSVVVADFNADSKPDMAVAFHSSNKVSILLGNGSGGFGAATNFVVGSNPSSIAVGDFNGDGRPDLVITNQASNNVSVMLGNGSGGFGMAPTVAVGEEPYSVAVLDYNGDGKLDFVTANRGFLASTSPPDYIRTISIVLGDGSGGFGAATNVSDGISYSSVAVGDFDSDGKPDLVFGSFNPNYSISVHLSKTTNYIPLANASLSVVVKDFNGDGKLDLAAGSITGNNVLVLLGDGTGKFGAPVYYNVGSLPYSIAVGDFNADGKPDLAAANFNDNNASVLLGNGSGGFTAATNFVVGNAPNSVAVGDFNGDGKPDLVTANYTSNDVSLLLNCTATANTPPSVANAIPNQSGTVGQAFAYTIAANTFTDTETPGSLALSVTGLPAGLSLTGRVISGTATAPGVSTVTVQATDPGSLAVSTTFTITISPAGSMTTVPTGPATLTITSFTCFSTAGALSSVNFVVGYNGGTFTPALPNLFINGVTITGQLGQSYTFGFDANAGPLLVQDYASRATYFVWDYRAACAGGVTPPVAMAPAAPALPNQTATQNSLFSYVVPAFTGTAPITYAATSLPAGLNFNAATRTISGTPTGTGVSTVMITASNSAGSGSGTFTITVNAATTPPSTPGSLTITNFTCTYTGATLSSVNFVVGYSGGTFTPALPNLFINGVTITGQLGQSYTFGFDANAGPLLVQDNASRATYFVWDYRAACAGGVTPPVAMAPAAPALPNQTATQNSPFSYVVPAFTGTAPITYAATSLPAGLNFNAATRTISGTPTGTGVSTVMITASNSAGSGSGTFTITVNAATTPPSTPGSLTITNFTCTYTGATLSSVNFVVGYSGGTFTPALPNLFINGVTITGQLGQSYTFGFDANAGPLLVQDNASRATYFVWNYRAACASLASPRIAAEPVTPWAVQLLGNPVRNELVVLISGAQGQSLALELITVAGNVVETRQILPTSAAHKEVFDVQRQSGGLLLLQVMSSTHRETLKVLKQ